jgi:hypothetical protein
MICWLFGKLSQVTPTCKQNLKNEIQAFVIIVALKWHYRNGAKEGKHLVKSRYKRFLLAGILSVLLTSVFSRAHAQDLEPRAYSNTPVGMNFLLTGYTHSKGGVLTDPAIPIKNGEIEINSLILAYMRAFDLGGMSSNFSFVAPYACASGSGTFAGQPRTRDVCGLADPRFQLTINFLGAPALSLKEFAGYKQDTIMGASLKVTPPVGQYDSSKLVNIGTNRWSLEPGIGISKAFGPVTTELAGGVTLYSDNTDYFGSQTLAIDPIYSFQGHIIYNFKSGIWCALDGTYYWGGLTSVNGIEGDTLQENTRVGATLALPLNRHNSVSYTPVPVFPLAPVATSTRWGFHGNIDGVVVYKNLKETQNG